MYPHERSLVKKLAGKPFTIIGVNSDRDIEIPRKLSAAGTVTWRSFQNAGPETPISQTWSVQGWPTLYLIGADGVIRQKYLGGPPTAQLDAAIADALAEIGVEFPEDEPESEDGEADSPEDKADKESADGE